MGEPKADAPPQPNGGVKQKPTSLNLGGGSVFYRNVNGRVNLNDIHLRHAFAANGRDGPRLKYSASSCSLKEQLRSTLPLSSVPSTPATALPAWSLPTEFEALLEPSPPPPPAPSHSPSALRVDEAQKQLSCSPSHNGFSLYTPPAPIPASGATKVRSTPNGLLSQPAPRRPHSIATAQYARGTSLLLDSGRPNPSLAQPAAPQPSATAATSVPATSSGPPPVVQRRSHSVTTPVSGVPGPFAKPSQEQHDLVQPDGTANGTRVAVPPQSLWNGQLQQRLPRRPHSIAATPTAATAGPLSQAAVGPATTARTPGEPIQWGASGLVLHQPVPRRAYATTLPHAQPPATTTQGVGLNVLGTNTWTGPRSRPHSIASNGTEAITPAVSASPSDSGYRSLPSASSDYQILQSPNNQQQQQNSASRRLSLPSAQSLLRANAPRPSPTFHGSPFRPFTCGVSPNGNPIFLGCTHLHSSNAQSTFPTSVSTPNIARTPTPATSPANMLTTSQAIQQLLATSRNGFNISDDKLALFIEILDTQDRFAKVSF